MNGRWFLKDDEEKFHSSDLILSSLFFLPPHLSLTLFFHIPLEFEEIIKKEFFFHGEMKIYLTSQQKK